MRDLSNSSWPATDEIDLRDSTCGDALREAAYSVPQRIALIEGHPDRKQRRRWTYADLLTAAERVARGLVSRFESGTHIAVWGANSPEWVILQFGLALSGMVMVTVNPAYRTKELAYLLRQSRSRGIFYQASYRGTDMTEMIAQVCEQEQLGLDLQVCMDTLEQFNSADESTSALPSVAPGDPVMIQYTSGTTGLAKGVLLNHYSVTNTARIMALIKGLDGETINLAVAPMFHTGGCVGGILGSVQTQGTVLLPESCQAESMLELIEEESVTYTFAVPTMLIALLEAQAQRPRDLSSLRTIFSGGSTVPIEVVRRVEQRFGVNLIIGYGLTETSPAITHTRLDDSPRDKSETIGRAIPRVEVKIVDPKTGVVQPTGVPGELCARGFNVMMGYYDMPEASAEAIDSAGWLHTGDLCAMDERGYCRVTGRLKDMIIRGGENIYPREIEEVLYLHPAVIDVSVIGIPDDYWGEQIGAVVVIKKGCNISGEELREFVSSHLARHKAPKYWFALDEVPMTASGKPQKYRLVEMFKAGNLEAAKF